MAQFQFNARQFQPATADGGNPPLPVGEWPMQITNSEIKQANNSNGGYLQLDVVIIDSEHKGHAGKWILNLYHENPQTVQIANRQLSALCHAIGVYDITDTAQLHGKPFIGVVKPNPSEKYPNGTQIGGVKDIQGRDPGKQQPAQSAQSPMTPPAAAQPPQAWVAPPAPPQAPVAPPAAPQQAAWAPSQAAQAAVPAPAPQQAWGSSAAAPAASAPPWANK